MWQLASSTWDWERTGGDSRDPTPPALLTHSITTGHLMPARGPCHWSWTWTRLQLTPTGTVRATAAPYHCRCRTPHASSISPRIRSIRPQNQPAPPRCCTSAVCAVQASNETEFIVSTTVLLISKQQIKGRPNVYIYTIYADRYTIQN